MRWDPDGPKKEEERRRRRRRPTTTLDDEKDIYNIIKWEIVLLNGIINF
tara:strand:+ start:115 stop:261 length:147 start_codon:yes stop_codon:yes gene_type:complete